MSTTTMSASAAARRTSLAATGMSFRGALQGYGEKPMTATRRPCTFTIVTVFGGPA
jgi:hypothetical protein